MKSSIMEYCTEPVFIGPTYFLKTTTPDSNLGKMIIKLAYFCNTLDEKSSNELYKYIVDTAEYRLCRKRTENINALAMFVYDDTYKSDINREYYPAFLYCHDNGTIIFCDSFKIGNKIKKITEDSLSTAKLAGVYDISIDKLLNNIDSKYFI